MIFLHCSTLMQTLPQFPRLSVQIRLLGMRRVPSPTSWVQLHPMRQSLPLRRPRLTSLQAPWMLMMRKSFCKWRINSAAIERSAKMSALRRKWGGKGKGGILGDLFYRHQGKGKGGYAYCKGSCKCPAGALKDGCLKKKGETILNQLDQGILPGEHTVDRPHPAETFTVCGRIFKLAVSQTPSSVAFPQCCRSRQGLGGVQGTLFHCH